MLVTRHNFLYCSAAPPCLFRSATLPASERNLTTYLPIQALYWHPLVFYNGFGTPKNTVHNRAATPRVSRWFVL